MRDNTSNWNGCYKISNPTLLFLFIIGVIYELGNLNILKSVHNEHPVPSNTIMLNFNLNILVSFWQMYWRHKDETLQIAVIRLSKHAATGTNF